MREEFKENEDLPNTTNPDDWAKIAGKKGERIVYVKPLMGESKDKQRPVERQLPASTCRTTGVRERSAPPHPFSVGSVPAEAPESAGRLG